MIEIEMKVFALLKLIDLIRHILRNLGYKRIVII